MPDRRQTLAGDLQPMEPRVRPETAGAALRSIVQRKLVGDLQGLNVEGLQKRLKAKGIVVLYKKAQELLKQATEDGTDVFSIDQLIEKYRLGAGGQATGQSGSTIAVPEGVRSTTEPASDPPSPLGAKRGIPPSSAVSAEVRSVIRAASETAQAEAVEKVTAKQAKRNESAPTAESKAPKKHITVKAGGTPLIINNVWIGDGRLGALERFNLFSWRALGHTVNIFVYRFDGKEPTAGDLGLESGDATVIPLRTILGEDESAAADTPAGSFGNARTILKTWLTHARPNDLETDSERTKEEKKERRQTHLYNIIDLTKSYIGGTRRGIVLDMKVGPSVHLHDYAAVFHHKMISYTRGGQTLGPENQSIGSMQESDELRKLYSMSFNKTLTDEMRSEPEKTWFNLFTATHGRSYANTKKWLDTATQMPTGQLRPERGSPLSVSEPGSSPGHGPFRVFKDASDQTNKSVLAKTKPSQVKALAGDVVSKELKPTPGVDEGFLRKAQDAMDKLPSV